MEVREICLAHVKEISQLFNEIFSREPWNDEWSEEDLSIYMHDLVGNRLSLSIGLYDGNQLIGIALGRIKHWYNGREFWIDEFGIMTDEQSKGLGSQFMDLVVDYTKKRGIDRIMLITEREFSATLMSTPDLKEYYYRDIEEEFKVYALKLYEDL